MAEEFRIRLIAHDHVQPQQYTGLTGKAATA